MNIILYYKEKDDNKKEYKNFDRLRFYDVINNKYLKDIKEIKNIDNLWVDYSSFYNNNIKSLINWILKRKYSITCQIRDIRDIREYT